MEQMPISEKQIKQILDEGEFTCLSEMEWLNLYSYYQPHMPYGTQKARDGDPYEWIFSALEEEYYFLIN